jgi:hypothetical protein
MQHAKLFEALFAYVNHMEDNTFKRILQDKQSIYRSKQSRRK